MKKIIFVNPPTPEKGVMVIRDLDRSGRKTREKTIWPQTNLAYLAAVMKNEGFDVEIMDCIADKIYWDKFEKIIDKKKPDYILFNSISSTISNDMRTASIAKENGAKSIAVGSHVTALPKKSMEKFTDLDFVTMGEAEETLKELVMFVENKKDFAGVLGIAWRNGGGIVVNEKRPLIKNLDSLPIPLHELLPINKYNLPFIGSKFTFVMESRGCPFRCTFCRSPIAWNRVFRTRSSDSIFKELQYLKKIGVKNILFHSDTFTVNKNIVIELCKKIIDNNLKIRWMCNSRVDTVDRETLDWMKKAGCEMIMYGIESGSQKVLDLSKKDITISKIIETVKNTRTAGIKVWGYFIIGLPGEDKETIEQTIKLAKELPLTLANFAVAAPYPGTEFQSLALEKGWLKSDNWEEYDQNYSAIVSYPDFTADEIIKTMKRAYKEFYFRPKVFWGLLFGIRSLHDIIVWTDVVFSHLKWVIFYKNKKKD
mgnify:CR=1 FL=1